MTIQTTPAPGGADLRYAVTLSNLPLMRRVCVAMFLIGGLTCLSGVWMTQSTPESQLAQGLVAGAFVVSGLVLWAIRRPRRWLLEGAVPWSILLLAVLIALSEPIGMAPLFLLWPVVLTAYFCSTRVLIAVYVWMTVALAVALALNQTHTLKLDTFIGTASAVGFMAMLVAAMTIQQTRLREELAFVARTDPLTDLLNRRAFNPQLIALVADAARRGSPLSVVMFDLDHFKRLNDEHGHLVGDEALRGVARVLREQTRGGDLAARFGGDEFAVALAGATATAARDYADRVAAALRRLDAVADLGLSLTVGISSLTSEPESAEGLLGRADEALYAAKAGGRCRPAWWDGGGIEVGVFTPATGDDGAETPTQIASGPLPVPALGCGVGRGTIDADSVRERTG